MRRIVAGVAIVGCGLITVSGSYAWAASRGPSTLKACVGKSAALVLRVDGKCPSGSKRITIGTEGPQGVKGRTGPRGATGPSDVYTVSKLDPTGPAVPVSSTGDYVQVLSLKLPAGTYLATQSVEYKGGSGVSFCYLGDVTVANADILTNADMTHVGEVATSADGVLAFEVPTALELRCLGNSGASVQRATITAVKVGAAHVG